MVVRGQSTSARQEPLITLVTTELFGKHERRRTTLVIDLQRIGRTHSLLVLFQNSCFGQNQLCPRGLLNTRDASTSSPIHDRMGLSKIYVARTATLATLVVDVGEQTNL